MSKTLNGFFFGSKAATNQAFLFVYALLLIIVRDPDNFTSPVFYADDATLWYRYAVQNDFFTAFFAPHGGYYSLLNNLSGIWAASLPMEYAPFVCKYLSVFSQMVPIAILITSTTKFWDTNLKKILIISYLTFILEAGFSMGILSVWFHFQLAGVFILCGPAPVGVRKWIYYMVFLIGALSGGVVSFLFPVVIYKYFKSKSPFYMITLAIMVIGICVQLSAVYYSKFVIGVVKSSGPILFNINYKALLTEWMCTCVAKQYYTLIEIPLMVVSVVYGVLRVRYFDEGRSFKLYGMLALVWGLNFLSSQNLGGGCRYAYVPNVIFFIMVLNDMFEITRLTVWAKMVTVLLLSLSALTYKTAIYSSNGLQRIDWEQEVAKYQEDKNYKMKIYPSGWVLDMNNKTRDYYEVKRF